MIRRFARMSLTISRSVMLGAVLACAPVLPVHAQQAAPDDDVGEPPATVSRPVVQSTAPSPTRALNEALARLARDPRDMTALVDAGGAALDIGDTDAAIGFLTRAEQVAPGSGGVRARIGIAMLRANQPLEAIRWFDLADQAGFPPAEMATERGLAYDLVGDNAAAQRQYQLAFSGGQSDEASRRYAISLVIAGDRRAAELVIQPLLERRDRGAWRVRTFIMAIAGQSDEAVGIAQATMPADLAAGIAPYLRYMPRLTPAQQAAAANLGRFPRAADIGRDDPQIVQYAALHPRAPRVDAGLVPAGAALGGKGHDDRDSRAKRRRPGRDAVVATAQPAAPVAAVQTPPAVSAPWGLPPGPPVQSRPQIAAAPQPAPAPAPRPTTAPVVLSKLDVPPGTPLVRAPLPAPLAPPSPAPQSAAQPASPATAKPAPTASAPTLAAPVSAPPVAKPVAPPAPVLAVQAPVPVPAPAPAPAPVTPAGVVSGAAYALLTSPQPAPAAQGAPQTAPQAAPQVAVSQPVIQPIPAPAQPAAAPADFRSAFDGYKPPEQEAAPTAEAVDLARIAALREAAKSARGKGKDKASEKDRGDRPDGPTAVSRLSGEEPLTTGAKSAKEKAAKAKAEADKVAKDKAALDKACADSKAGKGKGKGKSARAGKSGKSGKDPVCPAETEKDKKGKNGKAQPAHVSRIWVQVLTGANRDVMGREWQRLVREAGVLRGRKPSITPWRNNFRLLTGPFESDADAQAFIDKLRKDGVSSYEWTSPAGQAVDSLSL